MIGRQRESYTCNRLPPSGSDIQRVVIQEQGECRHAPGILRVRAGELECIDGRNTRLRDGEFEIDAVLIGRGDDCGRFILCDRRIQRGIVDGARCAEFRHFNALGNFRLFGNFRRHFGVHARREDGDTRIGRSERTDDQGSGRDARRGQIFVADDGCGGVAAEVARKARFLIEGQFLPRGDTILYDDRPNLDFQPGEQPRRVGDVGELIRELCRLICRQREICACERARPRSADKQLAIIQEQGDCRHAPGILRVRAGELERIDGRLPRFRDGEFEIDAVLIGRGDDCGSCILRDRLVQRGIVDGARCAERWHFKAFRLFGCFRRHFGVHARREDRDARIVGCKRADDQRRRRDARRGQIFVADDGCGGVAAEFARKARFLVEGQLLPRRNTILHDDRPDLDLQTSEQPRLVGEIGELVGELGRLILRQRECRTRNRLSPCSTDIQRIIAHKE